ncbi:peptide ABC transporter substrate-binding protein [Tianweitania sediminis]|uniref:Peptide ABC transporter substrate-binding protein n=1 Tax=Tianweitania sediminis TaxID=1502156 RepID=A0A8J7RSI2_9HYPH|nr:peptide ABC transporter substrate-binding protein [Tianweitania sediminis]MBP0441219.1 peptide ABC transporter substrate-binding protein [Tianweitania sediminis]HEV7418162.1 peptide ABC transporter substrate-binding protein [Tianweitania sediminis]
MLKSLMGATFLASATFVASLPMAANAQAEVVYNRGNDTDPTTLDHHKTSTVAEGNLMRDLYEGLVVGDAKAEVIPGVAESWEVSEDGLTYTFKLREDAKWSNGDPVTASDFVFAYQRIQNPETAAPYANMLYVMENAEAINKGEKQPSELGARAIDDRTLEIKLNAPTPYFLQLLTHQTGFPIHQKSVEQFGNEFTRPGNMVTNGAYMLEAFTPNDKIVMRKNPHFHDAENVAIDVVNWIPFEERATCLRRFEAGEVLSCSDLDSAQMDYMKEKLGEQVHVVPYLGTYYLPVKGEEGSKLKDAKVRQAISMAIDRDFLAKEIWRDSMLPGYSIVPPGIDNYPEPVHLPYKDQDILDREDEAKKLLEEAGVAEGSLSVELRHNTGENHKNTMTAIADMLKNIGITATIVEMEGTGYFDYMKNDGDFDITRAGWIGDYSDPQNFLFLFESANLGFNYPRWENADYDKLMTEASMINDIEARAKVLRQAEELFLKEVPAIPILYYSSGSLVSSKLNGWEDNIMNQHPTRWMSVAN